MAKPAITTPRSTRPMPPTMRTVGDLNPAPHLRQLQHRAAWVGPRGSPDRPRAPAMPPTGGVGLNVIQGGVLAAASKIIAIDVLDSKLDYARTMGATHTINATTTDPVKAVQELTGGRGVDYAFEAIGNTQAARQAFDMVRRGGTAVIVGMMPWGSEIALPGPAFLGEKKCIGSFYGSTRFRVDMPRLCEFYLQGKIKLDELVTRRYQLGEINEAFAAMKRGEVARSIIPLAA
ncbi:MAG: hypothetical protein C4327_12115 [Meiothermus sp.]